MKLSLFSAPQLALLLLFLANPGFAQSQECSTPLPSDVASPQQVSGQGKEAFLGTWGNAKWDGLLCHTLVVESLPTESTAVVVYSHGAYAGWNLRAPGFYRVTGRIEGETLHLNFPSRGARVEYRIVDGKLAGRYITARSAVSILMTRK